MGQRPYRVKVVGQDDDRIDRERVTLARLAERRAQERDMIRQQRQSSLREVDGEEEASAGDEVATIRRHGGTLPQNKRWVSQGLAPSHGLCQRASITVTPRE